MVNLEELFEDTIKDLYSAEKQFLRAMPKVMKATRSPELKRAIRNHIAQSEGHVLRLEKIAQISGFNPIGNVCQVAQNLVAEGNELLQLGRPSLTRDVAIIAWVQKIERYEISSYETVIGWAEALGKLRAVTRLQASLEEEQQTYEVLGAISESIIATAASVASVKAKLSASLMFR